MTLSRPVAALFAVPALTLAACGGGGGGNSDKDKITSIIKDGGNHPETICDHLTDQLLKAFKGKDDCRAKAKVSPTNKNTKVDSVAVSGSTATAKVQGKGGTSQTITFVKQGGDWKISGAK